MKLRLLVIILFFVQTLCYAQSDDENFIQAKAHYNQHHYDQAIELLNLEIQEGNDNAFTRFLLGECYFQKAEYEQAIEHYLRAYKLKNEFSTYRIAECYALQNQEYKAVEYLKVYLKYKDKLLKSEIKTNFNFKGIESSKSWNALWKEEHYNSYENQLDEAGYLISVEKYADAFYILDRLIIKDKNRNRALALRAELYLLTKDYKLAAQDFLKASALNKRVIDYKIKAAESYMKMGKFSKAIQLYSDIQQEHPEQIEILTYKALCEIELKEYDKAESDINEYIRFYSDDTEALNISGRIFVLKGDYLKALEQYNLCIKNQSDNYIYFYNRADVYFQTGMYENAVYDYSMALDLNPHVAEVYYKRGIANLKINIDDACIDFKQARSMNFHKADDYIVKYCE